MNNNTSDDTGEALLSTEKALPEITFKALVLGIVLAIVLAASNAFLGLKAGTTISASIPAAIISMGVLRLFRNSNVLENNIVQTAASAGEALVAGMAYIVPALLVLGYWHDFNYFECVMLAIAGGGLGAIYSIPIRRLMLSNPRLPFPEGVAIGNVLKASNDRSVGLHYLINGGVVGGVIGFAQDGLKVLSDAFIKWGGVDGLVMGYGVGFSPALIAAGYIVGIEVCASLFIGTLLGWLFGIPILSHFYNQAGLSPGDFVDHIGHTQLRYVGLGTMLVGGLATMFGLIKPMMENFRNLIAEKRLAKVSTAQIPRTEKDLPIKPAIWGFVGFILIVFFILRHHVVLSLNLTTWHASFLVVTMVVFVAIAAFIFSCLCAYFSGLVGATNNPGSAMTLASVIMGSFIMIVCLGTHIGGSSLAAASIVILASTIVSNSSVVTCETIQDLKAGKMVGATPWKQQFMMIVGVFISALIIPAVLKLLFNAYGIAGVYPHPGMDPHQSLSAPQSSMMAVVVKAVFAHDLPWPLLITGFVIAFSCMFINLFLRRKKLHIVLMAVGLGIYIPLDSITPMVLGGLIAYFVKRYEKRTSSVSTPFSVRHQRSLMLACGMVAGCALMGVILAIPFAISQSTDVLAIVSSKFDPIASTLSFLVTFGIMYWIYYVGARSKTHE